MTNDPTSPGTPEPEDPSPVGDAMADARAAFTRAGFSTPTGMVALAGLILIGVDIVFGLLLADYPIEWALLAFALVAVFVYYGKGAYNRIAPDETLLKLTGMVMAALVGWLLLYDLRYASSSLDDIPEILGALFTAGAGVLPFLGARAIK